MIDKIEFENLHLGIIIRSSYSSEGISFCTNDDDPLQLGYMNRPKDYIIPPHSHNKVKREVEDTHEVLFIKSGKVRIDFYNENHDYLISEIVNQGDVVLLAEGGHGFKMLENAEIIEVKQGPYLGEKDKNRFVPLEDTKVIYRKTT